MEEAEIPLDKDFHKDERLFHYTSAEGLYGILDSECLWATHFKFLNDSSEFFAARKWLLDFVHRAIHKKVAALKVNGSVTFKEGTDIFSKNNLFYTRRIGKTPENFYNVSDSMKEGETLEDNPSQVKLLNAFKISGFLCDSK